MLHAEIKKKRLNSDDVDTIGLTRSKHHKVICLDFDDAICDHIIGVLSVQFPSTPKWDIAALVKNYLSENPKRSTDDAILGCCDLISNSVFDTNSDIIIVDDSSSTVQLTLSRVPPLT